MTARRRLPEILRRPPQGWSSLFFLLSMLVVLGFSFANARPLQPVAGGASLTSSLPVLLPLAGLIGMQHIRDELEDRSFDILNPDEPATLDREFTLFRIGSLT